ncbi:uncharacterized protein LOC129894682 [Solanum dulcamara]|uniref:uncharacterized protein LOC129894682 n=1 Tax=Solanum dulcamara TaxID=45834 RepID=UPI0024861563|nr:uncharacterized protein LOC129894682 [Solanum dulcamara]
MSQKDLNSRPRCWIELLADYDISILYHSGKVDIVADALSLKTGSMGSLAYLSAAERPLALDMQYLANRMVRLKISDFRPILAFVGARSSLLDQIRGWAFQRELGTRVDLSMEFHPQTDGQSECTIQVLEDMLRASDRVRTAQSRHQSYADHRRRPLRFEVGDRVFLRVSPLKGVIRFGRQGKLSPKYIRPFEILRKVGEVAYELALPPAFLAIHPIFHISMLHRYIPDESHEPIAILARDVRHLRSKSIPVIKVQWCHHPIKEDTWETK